MRDKAFWITALATVCGTAIILAIVTQPPPQTYDAFQIVRKKKP